MGDGMSSSINSKPKIKQSKGTKAAIIRPVNRRTGKQTFVRIDGAENAAASPHMTARAVQLEDYVKQIRVADEAPQAEPAMPAVPAKPAVKKIVIPLAIKTTPKKAVKPKPKTESVSQQPAVSVVNNIALKQRSTPADMTHADHVDVLRTIAKLDDGYQWIADSNRAAATEAAEISKKIEVATTPEPAPEPAVLQTTTEPLSQDVINSIATAIASVLTETSESKLNAKIDSGITTEPAKTEPEETLKLTPELPRPGYTLPVTGHSFEARTVPKPKLKKAPPRVPAKAPVKAPPKVNTISLSAAAWDVPAFRWPKVTDQILSLNHMVSSLADNCQSMLSPFGKTIVVTAPTRGQGTTTMSLTLARAFASRKKSVLLVDGDIMNPSLSSTVGMGGVDWYRNHLTQEPVGECIIRGQNSGVCVMPLNAPVANVIAHSAPIFDVLESQLDKVRGEFDMIVIDAGPVWQIVDEISNDSHLVDVAMLVNQDTYSNGFADARERLMDRGIFKFIAAQNSFARRAG